MLSCGIRSINHISKYIYVLYKMVVNNECMLIFIIIYMLLYNI